MSSSGGTRAETIPTKATAVEDLKDVARIRHESRCFPYGVATFADLVILALVASNALDSTKLQQSHYARLGPRRSSLRMFMEKVGATRHLFAIQSAAELKMDTSGNELSFNVSRVALVAVDRLDL